MASTSVPRLKRAPSDRCRPVNVQYPACNHVGNDVRTCYPTASTVIEQDEWTKVVWNANHPVLAQLGRVDVYLLSADSGFQVANWTDIATGKGEQSSCADDIWLAGAGANTFNGSPLDWNFRWLIVQAGTTLTGAEPKEPVFRVRQTHQLDAQLQASASSAAAAASSASEASKTRSEISTSPTSGGNGNGPGGLQNGSSSDSFPHWAIALLAVLGFFALLGFLFFAFFMCRDFRQRRRRKDHARRESVGSESPMMASIGAPTSPQSPAQALLPSSQGHAGAPRGSFPRSYRHDASSTTSHTDSGPFSGADAAFVANAFRDALRKPDFKDRPLEEGESPDALPKEPPDVVMSKELAEEGRDIRSVRSERGVKVESLIDHEQDDHGR
ncbi:hypothetical protein AURDEDRAFT_115758 [Auricularia subglabra TFB-10046 SS5]|uniref:Uncharacterized protein n=1 Tax=Auricularia subglabra (strain TFB-10046 / SS5) TaxID=717982 RepID=J0LJU4_AURST|nr:hypothetical protein AURDEDRAFT_115758 [Auricularia subglabra TFB-10046 SS5]